MLAIWIAAQAVLSVLLYLVLRPLMMPLLAARTAALAQGTAPAPGFPPNIGLIICLYIVMMLWLLMLFTAVVRLAQHKQDDRFGWLRLGMDELRLVGLVLLLIVATIAAELLIVLVGFIIGLIGAVLGQTAAIILIIIYGIAILCAACWVEVRLMLVAPITVLRGKISIREGWRATRGHFWPLFGTVLLLGLALVLCEFAILAIAQPQVLRAMFSGMSPQETAMIMQAQIETVRQGPSIAMLLFFPIGIIIGTTILAYVHGIFAMAAVAATNEPMPVDASAAPNAGPWGR